MALDVTLAVLGAALAHAAWNAIVKSGRDVLLDTALVAFFAGAVLAPFTLVVEAPAAAAWPCIVASMLLHVGYYIALAGAYRAGDLSHGYPIMRGVAPLIVSVCALLWLREMPAPSTWAGVLLICGGVLSLGLAGWQWQKSRASLGWALANACIIAAYTLVDAAGVRAAGKAEAYVVWRGALNPWPFLLLVLWLRRGALLEHARVRWPRAMVGGALAAGAYGVVLWAMTRAPVAAVAALRETSVIFGALIGAWLLKEGHIARRVGGAVTVAAGVVALKL